MFGVPRKVGIGEKKFVLSLFTRGSYFRGTKMVLISAEPFFVLSIFTRGSYFRETKNGSYFRGEPKNAKIWTPEVLKRENEVRAKKWTFTVRQLAYHIWGKKRHVKKADRKEAPLSLIFVGKFVILFFSCFFSQIWPKSLFLRLPTFFIGSFFLLCESLF